MKKKRFLPSLKFKNLVNLCHSFLLFILLSICLNACTAYQPSQQPEPLQGKLLILLPSENELNQLIAPGFQEFQRLNPNVEILSEYSPKEQLSRHFIQQAQTGLGASAIIDFPQQIPELVKLGRIQPIAEKSIDLSDYFPSTLAQVRYQGKVYGVPLVSQTRALCYNQAKLQVSKDSILSQPPTNLDGLIQRARKGDSVGMVSFFEDTFWGIGSFGGSFFDNRGRIQPQLEGWEKWLTWLKQASTQPNFILLREKRDILHQAFAQGKLTYYVCNSNEIPDLKKTLQDNLKVALLPGQASFKAAPLLYTKVMIFNRSASPNEIRLALALAKFFTNPEQQLQGIVATQSFIPSNRKVTLDVGLLPIESALLEQSKTAVAIPLDNLEQLMPVFEQGELLYQQAIAGEIAPAEAVRQLTLFTNRQINQTQGE